MPGCGTVGRERVNGAAGVLVTVSGKPVTVIGFTVVADKIVEIDAIADAEHVRTAAAAAVADEQISYGGGLATENALGGRCSSSPTSESNIWRVPRYSKSYLSA